MAFVVSQRVASKLLRSLSDRYRFPPAASHEKRANTFFVIARWLDSLDTKDVNLNSLEI